MMSSLPMVSSRLDDASTTTSSALNNRRRRNTKTNLNKKTNKTYTTITRCQTSQTASFTPKGAKISGVGKALPKKFITNDDLAKLVETNDEWIRTRTGIGKRHVISGDETLTSLAAEASLGALKMANVNPEDIDLIIVATSSAGRLVRVGVFVTKRDWRERRVGVRFNRRVLGICRWISQRYAFHQRRWV